MEPAVSGLQEVMNFRHGWFSPTSNIIFFKSLNIIFQNLKKKYYVIYLFYK